MALSEMDKEWIKLTARELAFAATKEVLRQHIDSCPYGKKLLKAKALMVGIGVGIGLVSGATGFAIARAAAGF